MSLTLSPAAPSPRILVPVVVGTAALAGAVLAQAAFLGLAIGVVACLVIAEWPRATTGAVVALVLLYANVPVIASDRLGLPPSLTGLAVPGLLAVVAWHQLRRGRGVAIPPPLAWLLAFVGAVTVSTVLSPAPELAVPEMVTVLTEGLLLYLLVVHAVRDGQTLRACVWALIATSALLALLSLAQTVSGAYHMEFGGLAQHAVDDVQALAADPDAAPVRVAGPVGEKNRYAQHLLMVLPLALVMSLHHPRARTRVLAGAASAAVVVGVALTMSRGAALAAALLLVTMVVMREIGARGLLVAAAGVLVIGLAMPSYGSRLVNAMPVLQQGSGGVDEADGAVRGRLSSNLGSLRVFLDHPVVGVGPGVYPRFHRDAVEDLGLRVVPNRQPHTLYLGLAAEVGLLGFATFGALVAATLWGLWRTRRRHPRGSPPAMLASGLFLGLLAYLYAGLFLHLSYARYFWMMMALGAVVPVLDREPAGARTP